MQCAQGGVSRKLNIYLKASHIRLKIGAITVIQDRSVKSIIIERRWERPRQKGAAAISNKDSGEFVGCFFPTNITQNTLQTCRCLCSSRCKIKLACFGDGWLKIVICFVVCCTETSHKRLAKTRD